MARRRRRKKSKPSTRGEKANLVDYKATWDKQCEGCRWIYNKLHKICPKCEGVEWDLVGRVYDPDGQTREAEPSYTPTQAEIRQRSEEIREDWDEDRLKQQERFRSWKVPVSLLESPDDL